VVKETLNEDLSVDYEWYEVRQRAGSHAR